MNRFIKIIFTSVFILMLAEECEPSNNVDIVVPSSDSTPPNVILKVDKGSNYEVNIVNINELSSPISASVNQNDKILVLSRGTDSDGGVKNIQLWINYTYYKPGQQIGPGLLGAPTAHNPSSATIGNTTATIRESIVQLDMTQITQGYTGVDVLIFGEVLNFHGGDVKTPTVTLSWRQ